MGRGYPRPETTLRCSYGIAIGVRSQPSLEACDSTTLHSSGSSCGFSTTASTPSRLLRHAHRILGPAPNKDDGPLITGTRSRVQDDLHQHLAGNTTPATVQRELIRCRQRRTDITYTPERAVDSSPSQRRTTTDPGAHREELRRAAATTPPPGRPFACCSSVHQAATPPVTPACRTRLDPSAHARSATEFPGSSYGIRHRSPTPSALRMSCP